MRQRREHPGSDKPDIQPPCLPGTDAARFAHVSLDVAQGSASTLQKGRPGGGERDRARGSRQKRTSNRTLEPADGLGERRLGHVQPHGSATEVQFLGNGDEVAKMAKLHVHMPSIWIDTNGILDVSVEDHDTGGVDLIIRPLRTAADADAFRVLNEEWIAKHFAIEDQDHRQLDDPVAAYIDTGGEILIAELDGQPIGCVALVPDGTGAYELSKMVISPELRGRGAGRTLLTSAIEHAKQMNARSLFLGSSKKLANAVHLYEAVGFQHVSPGTIHMPYARADVFMQLMLPQTVSPHPHG